MPDLLEIRRLGPADIRSFRDLNALFGQAFEDPETYGGEPPSDQYLGQLLAKAEVIVLVAYTKGEVAGGLVAYVLDKFERARRELYIYDLAVAAAHRRRGLATALIRKLQAVAAEMCAWVVYVQADPEDAPAVALYKGLGTREEVFHFDFPVGDGRP